MTCGVVEGEIGSYEEGRTLLNQTQVPSRQRCQNSATQPGAQNRVLSKLTVKRCRFSPTKPPVGAASALKAAYSGYQKTAYLLAGLSHALAVHHGIDEDFLRVAIRSAPGTPLAVTDRITTGAAKAWRWIDEFGEIADALTEADLPPEIARAAAVILDQ